MYEQIGKSRTLKLIKNIGEYKFFAYVFLSLKCCLYRFSYLTKFHVGYIFIK